MIIYSIFDVTNIKDYKHIMSSNDIGDIYNKVKSYLELNIDYDNFIKQYKRKTSRQYLYQSLKNFKSVMVIITNIKG